MRLLGNTRATLVFAAVLDLLLWVWYLVFTFGVDVGATTAAKPIGTIALALGFALFGWAWSENAYDDGREKLNEAFIQVTPLKSRVVMRHWLIAAPLMAAQIICGCLVILVAETDTHLLSGFMIAAFCYVEVAILRRLYHSHRLLQRFIKPLFRMLQVEDKAIVR